MALIYYILAAKYKDKTYDLAEMFKYFHKVEPKEPFIGRRLEQERLRIAARSSPSIIIVYGRRRIGKTELIEQTFKDRNLLKFEGIQGQDEEYQMNATLRQLALYTDDPVYKSIKPANWSDVFSHLARLCESGAATLYFEELQWLANYSDGFVSELKYYWDNHFRHNKNLVLILCGSAPSFMVGSVIKSQALYNRSQHVVHLTPLSLKETYEFFDCRKSYREVMDAHLLVGGVPEYLNYLKTHSSILTSLYYHSFLPSSFFASEMERVFVSSLGNNKHYRRIVDLLAQFKFLTRKELAKKLGISSGGTLTELLDDLEVCGFIDKYTPLGAPVNSTLARSTIKDSYLLFYYAFLQGKTQAIDRNEFKDSWQTPITRARLMQWLGLRFELWCRQQSQLIARILQFQGIEYQAGAFFNRKTSKEDEKFQIDLMFERKDRVCTVCEIKYTDAPVGTECIKQMERAITLLDTKKSVQRVLISASGVAPGLDDARYFDAVITLDDIFGAMVG